MFTVNGILRFLRPFNGEKQSFQKIVLRQEDSYIQKNEVELLPHTKINSKGIKDPNMRAKVTNP